MKWNFRRLSFPRPFFFFVISCLSSTILVISCPASAKIVLPAPALTIKPSYHVERLAKTKHVADTLKPDYKATKVASKHAARKVKPQIHKHVSRIRHIPSRSHKITYTHPKHSKLAVIKPNYRIERLENAKSVAKSDKISKKKIAKKHVNKKRKHIKKHAKKHKSKVYYLAKRVRQTIGHVFQSVLFSNPNILSAQATQRAAKSTVNQMRASYYPTLNATYGVGYEYSQAPGAQYITNFARQRSLVMTQILFNGGENVSSVESAKAAYKQAAHLTDEQINTIARQTAETYVGVIRFKRLVYLAKSNVDTHIKTYKNMEIRYEKGAGRRSELALAKGRLARAKVTLYNTRNEYRNARVAYAQVVGHMPGRLYKPRILASYLPKTLAAAELQAYLHNPSLAAAKKALKAAKYEVKKAEAAFSPDVSLQTTLSQNQDINAVQGQTNIYQVLLLTTYNLYNGGADLAAYRKALEDEQAAKDNLNATRRDVIEQVRQSWNNLYNSKRRLGELALHVKSSKEVVAAYNEEFKIGKRSLLNLLDAENELFNSRSDLANGENTVLVDSYNLMASIGILPKYLLAH